MKLSEYIEHLQKQVDEHGDVDVVEYNYDDYGECFYSTMTEIYLGEVCHFKNVRSDYPELVTVVEGIDVSKLKKAYVI